MYKTSFVLLTGLIAVTFAAGADARERQRSGSYATSGGREGSFEKNVSGNLKEGLSRQQSVTNKNGETFNRSATNTFNKKTGDFNRTVTGFNGKTREFTGIAGNGQSSGTYTLGNGQTGSFNSNNVKNENGTVTRTQNWTDANGETKTRTATGSYDPETKTYTRNVTTPSGQVHTDTITRDNGTATRTQSWTDANGETKTRSTTGSYDPETKTYTRTITNPEGKTRTATVNYDNEVSAPEE